MSSDDETRIDQRFLDKQSRTIGTYGLETMAKLISFKVLVVGCGGVGVEVAKNLALAGIHTLTLHDPRPATVRDMGVNFAVSEAAIAAGRSVAEASQQYLAELNPLTRVVAVSGALDEALVRRHHAVVYTAAAPDLSLRTLTRWDDFCRAQTPAISFVLALQTGTLGSVFADHGAAFTVRDPDGRPMLQKSVLAVTEHVDADGDRYSRVRYETPEGQVAGALRDYTQLQFSDVRGLVRGDGASVNGAVFDGVVCPGDPRDTVRIYPSFATQGYGAYETGGFVQELKSVTTLSFRPLAAALRAPGTFIPVSPMMDGSEESQTHAVVHALLHFADDHDGRLPALHSADDAEVVVQLARRIVDENRQAAAAAAGEHNSSSNNNAVDDDDEESVATTAASQATTTTTARPPHKDGFPFRPPPPPPPTPLVLDVLDEASVRTQAMLARAELQPLAAFVGAVVAQEIVKITGKYTPVHQWFHLSYAAVLPHDYRGYLTSAAAAAPPTTEARNNNNNTDDNTNNNSNDSNNDNNNYAPRGSRYDHLIALLGASFVEALTRLRVFMVGCGALGCENLKNFALCGLTCSDAGTLVVTDNDRIEVSNLSRQFLFREDNVGQSKSAAAGARVRQMNAACVVDARQDFVGATTEHLFPDTFWCGVDVVVNALDNMEARLYVDQQCVRFHKVLVEAGTMGTGGNVDIVVPARTSSYADGGAADQTGGIPMCTLRNFPYIYDHCIEWARAQFDDLFVAPMQTALQVVDSPEAFVQKITREVAAAQSAGERHSLIEKHMTPLRALRRTLATLCATPTMHTCVALSWELLFRLFRDRILDLQTAFPADAKKKNGEPFWSGHRRYPTALHLGGDGDGDDHDAVVRAVAQNADVANLLIAMSNLFACAFGVHPSKPDARYNDEHHRWMAPYRRVEWLCGELATLRVPDYVAGAVDGLDDDVAADAAAAATHAACESSDRDDAELQALLRDIAALARTCHATSAAPLEFEKDDDDNFQIDFIAAASNLRAGNYGIAPQDRMKVKLVAGKIIPAIATTTSAVTGLALIELFKVLQGKDVSTLRNGMLDLGTNNYVLFERDPPLRYTTRVVSTYLPEQDCTYRKRLVRVPDGYTKYDMLRIPVTPATTVQQFADALVARLDAARPPRVRGRFEVDGVGVGKGLLWNGRARHANTHASLMQLIAEQKTREAGGSLPKPFWQNRVQFCDLSVTVSLVEDDEDDDNNDDDDGDEPVDEVEVETATICLVIDGAAGNTCAAPAAQQSSSSSS